MNTDNLTIGEIITLLGGVSAARGSALYTDMIGKPVLIRSRGSGVWAATLDAHEVNAAGNSVRLSNARRLWSWTGAGECSSLALTGPSGGKIGPACSVIVTEVLEVHPMQRAAVAAVAAVAPWGLRDNVVHDGSGGTPGGGSENGNGYGDGDVSGYGDGYGRGTGDGCGRRDGTGAE